MNYKLKSKLVFLFLIVVFLGFASVTLADVINIPNPLCLDTTSPNCISTFSQLITKITDFILDIIGVLSVLMFVIAGIFYLISAGRPEWIKRGKDTALYAAIGIAIALLGKGLILVITDVIGTTPPGP